MKETSQSLTMYRQVTIIALIFLVICVVGCRDRGTQPGAPRYERYTPQFVSSTVDSNKIFAVVEIPAGTCELQAMDTTGTLHQMSDRPIDFLPIPGNYGFIAGCGRRDSLSNNLAPLPVLVMMAALAPESILEVLPIATLVLNLSENASNERGQSFPVVIAIPVDTSLQTIHVDDFVDLITEYDAARSILKQWFLNYRGREMFGFSGWQDEHYTRQLIRDWKLRE